MSSPVQILILGNYRNALTVARRLGGKHRIILAGNAGIGRVEKSRYVQEIRPLPDALDEQFPDVLETLLQRMPDKPVLFPIGDNELFALLSLPSVVDGKVKTVMPAPSVVAACLDKTAMVNLASSLQIPQATFRKVKQLSELQDAVREVGCPCIIKSDHQLSRAFGKKAYLVSDQSELRAVLVSQQEPEHGLIVQAVASGLRHNVYFAAEKGRLVGAMEARVVRTDIYDGSGFTVESRSVPLSDALLKPTERLVEALDYHGIGNTQFLVDPKSNSLSFLEISPRMGAAFALTVPCGFDFSKAGLNLALDLPSGAGNLPPEYPSGRRFAWSVGDLQGLYRAILNRDILATQAASWLWSIARSAVLADIHASWSWRDPRPAASIVLSFLCKLLPCAGRSRRILDKHS